MMTNLGKSLLLIGLAIAAAGAFFWLVGDRLPLGRLPGDIAWRKKGVSVYFPLASCLVVSILLTLLANIFFRNR